VSRDGDSAARIHRSVCRRRRCRLECAHIRDRVGREEAAPCSSSQMPSSRRALEWTALTPPIVMLEIARSYALMPSPTRNSATWFKPGTRLRDPRLSECSAMTPELSILVCSSTRIMSLLGSAARAETLQPGSNPEPGSPARLHACTPDRGARRGHGGGWAAAGGAIGTATIRAFGRIWKALLDVVRLSTSLE
jgi:hypothetical protein